MTTASASIWSAARSVAARELRSAVRDRQTLIYAVVMPLALYPVLFWVLLQGLTVIRGREDRTLVQVGIARAETETDAGAELVRWLEDSEGGPVRVVPLGVDAGEPRALLAEGRVDAVLVPGAGARPGVPTGTPSRRPAVAADRAPPELMYDGSRPRSELARRRVAERFSARAEDLRTAALRSAGFEPERLTPFELEALELSSDTGRGGFLLSYLLPMMLVLMAVMGAFIPAVDATAGEKERGTLETSLLAPAPRLGLHLGVLLAVATTSLVATLLNLAGMALAAKHLFSMLPGAADAGFAIPLGTLAALLPFALLFVLFASAVLTAAASTADTFKQGQALLGSVQLVFLVPAMVGVLPGMHLTPALALVPVLQVVLAIKAILQQAAGSPWPWASLALAAAATALYTGLALALSVRVLSRQTLGSGGRGGLRRLFQLATSRTENLTP